MKRQSGFTLIELIIVIVILGILAVTAAPQFFNFGGDARSSTVRGLEGSIQAGSELVHARAQINTQVANPGSFSGFPADSSFVEVRSDAYALLNGMYAEASANGIGNALSLSGNDWVLVEDGLPDNTVAWRPASVSPGESWNLEIDGTSASGQGCFAFYQWDDSDGTPSQPVIGSLTNGC